MWRLIRFAFSRWCSKQQGVIDRLSQAKRCQNVAAQVTNDQFFVPHLAICAGAWDASRPSRLALVQRFVVQEAR
jgi:hypothetical protein